LRKPQYPRFTLRHLRATDTGPFLAARNLQYRVAATSLIGVLEGPATPVFWNIDKSE